MEPNMKITVTVKGFDADLPHEEVVAFFRDFEAMAKLKANVFGCVATCSWEPVPDAIGELDELYVNDERTVLVRKWANGTVETATRETPAHTWGPPVYLKAER